MGGVSAAHSAWERREGEEKNREIGMGMEENRDEKE